VYEPALYHEDIAYMPKPASFDTSRTATYLSGGFNAYSNTHWDDFLMSGQVNLSRGYVFKNFNLAYGAFGVLGDYQSDQANKNAPYYFSDKFFGAVGGRFSANTYVNMGRTDFRFIGVEMAYSHEFGAYANYRQFLNTQPGYYVDPRTNLFTIGLTTEVIFHNVNNINFENGFRGFLGTTVGYNQLDDTFYRNTTTTGNMFRNFFPKVTYFIKFKNYFGSIDGGTDFFIRFGRIF
jgi:hypothetical protein